MLASDRRSICLGPQRARTIALAGSSARHFTLSTDEFWKRLMLASGAFHHRQQPEETLMTTAPTPIQLPARSVPVPSSISQEARQMLSRAAESEPMFPPFPADGDIAGWIAWKAAGEQAMRAIDFSGGASERVHCEAITLGGVPAFLARPREIKKTENVLFDIHGGALIGGAGDLCRSYAIGSADVVQATVYSPDYRLPPEHPFPVPLDDCVAAYRALLTLFEPSQIVAKGLSAGGNLATALMLRLRAEDVPLPVGLILHSPELDLTESGDTFQTLAFVDVVLREGLAPINRIYASGHDLADPFVSPLFGKFDERFPPTLLLAGTRDLFLSNAVRMHRALKRAGAHAELQVFEAMPHGGFFGAPEDQELSAEIKRFADACWNGRR
jgi:epsilon-lactone hydrolase